MQPQPIHSISTDSHLPLPGATFWTAKDWVPSSLLVYQCRSSYHPERDFLQQPQCLERCRRDRTGLPDCCLLPSSNAVMKRAKQLGAALISRSFIHTSASPNSFAWSYA